MFSPSVCCVSSAGCQWELVSDRCRRQLQSHVSALKTPEGSICPAAPFKRLKALGLTSTSLATGKFSLTLGLICLICSLDITREIVLRRNHSSLSEIDCVIGYCFRGHCSPFFPEIFLSMVIHLTYKAYFKNFVYFCWVYLPVAENVEMFSIFGIFFAWKVTKMEPYSSVSMSNATNWLNHNGSLSEILYCYRLNSPGGDARMSPAVARGFACPCHLCLCAWTSWRWHGALGLCVLLQGAKSFCNPSQGHCSCILATRCRRLAKYEVLKGPFGLFSSVDLSSDAGCIITERRWKGQREYWMKTSALVLWVLFTW